MKLFDLDKALLAALRADATLATKAPGGVHQDLAPTGTTGVFVTVTLETAREDADLNKVIGLLERTYTLAAWADGLAPATAEAAAEQVDATLLSGSLTLTGFVVVDVQRVDIINRKVLDETGTWQERGARYQIQAQPTS